MTTVNSQNVPLIRPDKDRFLAEENPFEAMMSRFDFAAQKLSLDPGLYQVLRAPEKQVIVAVPYLRDRGGRRSAHRLPRAPQPGPGPGQGRHPLRPRRHARRGEGARRVDDLEVRRRQHPVRRRQGRRRLRSQPAVQRRAGAHHPALHLGDHRDAGSRLRRARAGRQHQRAGHGVGDGHLLDARAPHRDGRGHRQAGRDGRIPGPARGDGAGLHAGDPGSAPQARHADRRNPGRRAGVRQRGVDRGRDDGAAGDEDRRRERQVRRGLQSQGAQGEGPPGARDAAPVPAGVQERGAASPTRSC